MTVNGEKRRALLKNVQFTGRFSQVYGLHHATVEQVGFRFASKLREEYGYRLADFSHLLIELRPDLPQGEIRIWKRRMETWQQHVRYGLDKSAAHSHSIEPLELVTNIIGDVLIALAEHYGSEPEPIEATRRLLLDEKEDTTIFMRSKVRQTDEYLIEPFFKVKGYGSEAIQLFVRLTDIANNQSGEWLIVQSSYREVCQTISTFVVKGGKLVVKPKGSVADLYKGCKFLGSAQVPLRSILGA
jgi:hypothetical protein